MVGIDDPLAVDPEVTGGKAAALARAHRGGLPIMPAVVITTAASERYDADGSLPTAEELEEVIRTIAPEGQPLAVRSSSVAEDQAMSSQAGQFETVLDVVGVEALRDAIVAVLGSRSGAGAGAGDEPMAVLVQPMARPELAGVAFGVDPVTGRSDHRVVVAVEGRPDRLVSGEVGGSRWILDERGHVVDHDRGDGPPVPGPRLGQVVGLIDEATSVFGAPQDVEWALIGDQAILFQSRPVTTLIRGVPAGPVFGPGPVAETFPEPLSRLEVDLWVPPLRKGVREALRISGAVGHRDVEERDLVIVVDGRVALDLEVTGDASGRTRRGLGARVRRLRSAWRIGRLRVALPLIAEDLASQVDEDLAEVPDLRSLSTRQLVALIGRGRRALRSLHAHEILMGMVTDPTGSGFTGASVALRVLAESRLEGYSDDEILRRSPVVLALVAPKVGDPLVLPSSDTASSLDYEAPEAATASVQRESLRLRTRWVQELVGQAAFEIGARLADRGVLGDPRHVRHMGFHELSDIVAHRAVPDAEALVRAESECAQQSPGLPARFRMSDRGLPIAEVERGVTRGGTGAGGGIGRGPVTHDTESPEPGSVLVVTTLTPQLGSILNRLTGVVAETGSVLSHLAILARERGVATVVAYPGATDLGDGAVVEVDGATGRVTVTGDGGHAEAQERRRTGRDRPADHDRPERGRRAGEGEEVIP